MFWVAMMATPLAYSAAKQDSANVTWRQVNVFAKEYNLEDYAASCKADGVSPSEALKKMQELKDSDTALKLSAFKGITAPFMLLILCLVFLIIYYVSKSCFSIVYKIQKS